MQRHPDYDACHALFRDRQGVRAYIRVALHRISDSCGYSVPLYDFRGDRDVLDKWAPNKGAAGILAYQAEKNRYSIDGLPGLT